TAACACAPPTSPGWRRGCSWAHRCTSSVEAPVYTAKGERTGNARSPYRSTDLLALEVGRQHLDPAVRCLAANLANDLDAGRGRPALVEPEHALTISCIG